MLVGHYDRALRGADVSASHRRPGGGRRVPRPPPRALRADFRDPAGHFSPAVRTAWRRWWAQGPPGCPRTVPGPRVDRVWDSGARQVTPDDVVEDRVTVAGDARAAMEAGAASSRSRAGGSGEWRRAARRTPPPHAAPGRRAHVDAIGDQPLGPGHPGVEIDQQVGRPRGAQQPSARSMLDRQLAIGSGGSSAGSSPIALADTTTARRARCARLQGEAEQRVHDTLRRRLARVVGAEAKITTSGRCGATRRSTVCLASQPRASFPDRHVDDPPLIGAGAPPAGHTIPRTESSSSRRRTRSFAVPGAGCVHAAARRAITSASSATSTDCITTSARFVLKPGAPDTGVARRARPTRCTASAAGWTCAGNIDT